MIIREKYDTFFKSKFYDKGAFRKEDPKTQGSGLFVYAQVGEECTVLVDWTKRYDLMVKELRQKPSKACSDSSWPLCVVFILSGRGQHFSGMRVK
jgi:hypothetical protein